MLRITLAVTLGMYELEYHIIISPYICTHLSQNNVINTTTSNMIDGNSCIFRSITFIFMAYPSNDIQ